MVFRVSLSLRSCMCMLSHASTTETIPLKLRLPKCTCPSLRRCAVVLNFVLAMFAIAFIKCFLAIVVLLLRLMKVLCFPFCSSVFSTSFLLSLTKVLQSCTWVRLPFAVF